jgi:class 3 adenylate cyclase
MILRYNRYHESSIVHKNYSVFIFLHSYASSSPKGELRRGPGFPENPDDALSAACAMREELLRYNRHRASTGYEAVDFGVGIHTGALMPGTIGENMRMDSTVISDAVNLASRIETLTRKHRIGIAVSEETARLLTNPQSFKLRHLGREPVKGKKSDVSIFSVEGAADP